MLIIKFVKENKKASGVAFCKPLYIFKQVGFELSVYEFGPGLDTDPIWT